MANKHVELIGEYGRKCVDESEVGYWLLRGFAIAEPIVVPKAKKKSAFGKKKKDK